MTTLIDDRRVHAAVAAPTDTFIFTWHWPARPSPSLASPQPYWVPLTHGTFAASPVVHFHGVLFFTWTLYFAFQSWLAASGSVAWHRSLGIVGVSLATAMTIFGFLVSVHVMQRSAAIGQTDAGVAFSIVPLSGILFFAAVLTLAIANARRPEIYKRLTLLAGISPPGRRRRALVSHVPRASRTAWSAAGSGTIAPAIVAYLLLVVAIVHDWRTRGRPHPVYIYGGFTLMAVKLLNWPISMTPAWQWSAGGILALAQ